MNKFLLVAAVLGVILVSGCALLDKLAPSQLDESGAAIPGSRQPTAITQAVAETVPYGELALTVLLFGVAGYERFRAAKLEKGLKATLLAGKKVASDPSMKEMWDKIKDMYRQEHETSGVTKLIKSLLAKTPSVTKSV